MVEYLLFQGNTIIRTRARAVTSASPVLKKSVPQVMFVVLELVIVRNTPLAKAFTSSIGCLFNFSQLLMTTHHHHD